MCSHLLSPNPLSAPGMEASREWASVLLDCHLRLGCGSRGSEKGGRGDRIICPLGKGLLSAFSGNQVMGPTSD